MGSQRSCKICGGTFEIERKAGRPRIYCFRCEPEGYSVVKVPHQSRVRLRRRPSPLSVHHPLGLLHPPASKRLLKSL
jgi:hypothetical protein